MIWHIASIVGDYLTTNVVEIWNRRVMCIPSPNGVSSVSRFIAEPDNLAFSALVAGNIEIPRGVRNRHGVLSFGGTYMEVSFDADVATEHGIRAAVVLNHIAHLMRLPDGSQVGYFKSCGRATATGTR